MASNRPFRSKWTVQHDLDRSHYTYEDAGLLAPFGLGLGVCILGAVGSGILGFPVLGGLFAIGALVCFASVLVAMAAGWIRVHIEVTPTRIAVRGQRPWARRIEGDLDTVEVEVRTERPDPIDPTVIPGSMALHVGGHEVVAPYVALASELEAFAEDLRRRQKRAEVRIGDADDVPEALHAVARRNAVGGSLPGGAKSGWSDSN